MTRRTARQQCSQKVASAVLASADLCLSGTMVKPARADRRVALFEDGDLWRDEEASPPESPAGWYFRPHGASAVWVGPFPTADAASSAPSRGDPVEVARRCLEEWRRSRAEPPLAGIGRGNRRILTLDEPRMRPQRDEPAPPVCLSASSLFRKSVQGEPERRRKAGSRCQLALRHHVKRRPWPGSSHSTLAQRQTLGSRTRRDGRPAGAGGPGTASGPRPCRKSCRSVLGRKNSLLGLRSLPALPGAHRRAPSPSGTSASACASSLRHGQCCPTT